MHSDSFVVGESVGVFAKTYMPALNDAHVDGFGPGWPNVEKVLAGMPLPNTNANNNGGLAVRSILTLLTTCGVAAAREP